MFSSKIAATFLLSDGIRNYFNVWSNVCLVSHLLLTLDASKAITNVGPFGDIFH